MPSITRFLSSFDRCYPSPPRSVAPIIVTATVDSTAYVYTFNPARRRNRNKESTMSITRVSLPGEFGSMLDDLPLAKNPLRCAMAEVRVESVSSSSTNVSSPSTKDSSPSTKVSSPSSKDSSPSTNVSSSSTNVSPATRKVTPVIKTREWSASVKMKSDVPRAKYPISTSMLEDIVEEDELKARIEAARKAKIEAARKAEIEEARKAKLKASEVTVDCVEVSSNSSAENVTEAPVAVSTPPVEDEAPRGRTRRVTPVNNEEVIPSPAPAAQTIDPVVEDAPTAETINPVFEDTPAAQTIDPVVEDAPTAQTIDPVVEDAPAAQTIESVVEDAPAAQTIDPVVEDAPAAQINDPVVEEVVPSLDPAARDAPPGKWLPPFPTGMATGYGCSVQDCDERSPEDGHFCDIYHRCDFILADGKRCTNMAAKWSKYQAHSKRCVNGFHDDPKDRKVLRRIINNAKKVAAQDRSDQTVTEIVCARAINTAYIAINDRIGPVLNGEHVIHMSTVMDEYRQAGLVPARRTPLFEIARYVAPIIDRKLDTPIYVASASIPRCHQTTLYTPGPDGQPVSTIVRGDPAQFPLSHEQFERQDVREELENRWYTEAVAALQAVIDAKSAAEAESTAKAQARAFARNVAKSSAKLRAAAQAREKAFRHRNRRKSAFTNLYCKSVPKIRHERERSAIA